MTHLLLEGTIMQLVFFFHFEGKKILILRGICMLNFKLIRLLKITLLGEATGLL